MMKRNESLNLVAKEYGFSNWSALKNAISKGSDRIGILPFTESKIKNLVRQIHIRDFVVDDRIPDIGELDESCDPWFMSGTVVSLETTITCSVCGNQIPCIGLTSTHTAILSEDGVKCESSPVFNMKHYTVEENEVAHTRPIFERKSLPIELLHFILMEFPNYNLKYIDENLGVMLVPFCSHCKDVKIGDVYMLTDIGVGIYHNIKLDVKRRPVFDIDCDKILFMDMTVFNSSYLFEGMA